MKTLEEALATAREVYVPKGKEDESYGLFDALGKLGMRMPAVSRKLPQASVRAGEGNAFFERAFTRMRAADALRLLALGVGDLAFAGTDVCRELIDSGKLTGLTYQPLPPGEGARPVTFELLFRNPTPELVRQIRGEGPPVSAVTSLPYILSAAAEERDLNIAPTEFVPKGDVEVMVNLGVGRIGADAVVMGDAAGYANLVRGRDVAADFVLGEFQAAAVWRER